MNRKSTQKFRIQNHTNPSGDIVFRVTGWLDGQRIRKNFHTRTEAEAERQILEIQAVQSETGIRTAATRLTDDQLHEAETLFRLVEGKPQPLAFYVKFALTNYREPERQKALGEALDSYLESKQQALDQDQLSIPQLGKIRWEMRRLLKYFPKDVVSDITPPRIVEYIESGSPTLKTFNNRRGILSTFFKYAFQRGWIVENPIPRVPHHRLRRKRGMATTLSAADARALMEHFEIFECGRWIPYFALCLFAGIRPGVPYGEITKITRDAINLETGIISVSAEVSKVREPRKIKIQPNLAAWLKAFPLSRHPLVVGDFQKRRAKFRDRFKLTHDVLRHTFISMFVAKFRSIGEAAIQAGNSESIIRRHYLDLKSEQEAEDFFNIFPRPKRGPLLLPVEQPKAPAEPAYADVEA